MRQPAPNSPPTSQAAPLPMGALCRAQQPEKRGASSFPFPCPTPASPALTSACHFRPLQGFGGRVKAWQRGVDKKERGRDIFNPAVPALCPGRPPDVALRGRELVGLPEMAKGDVCSALVATTCPGPIPAPGAYPTASHWLYLVRL